jgi:hypothetical protein
MKAEHDPLASHIFVSRRFCEKSPVSLRYVNERFKFQAVPQLELLQSRRF